MGRYRFGGRGGELPRFLYSDYCALVFAPLFNGHPYLPAHMAKFYAFGTHFPVAFAAKQQQAEYRPKEAFRVNEWVR